MGRSSDQKEIARLRALNAELVAVLEETYDWINPEATDDFREMASRVHRVLAKARGGK